jgi:hypothetical protein
MINRRCFVFSAGCVGVAFPSQLFAQSSPLIADGLLGQHPAAYYKHAMTLFNRSRKNDAVFVFYLGQLRYRTHLAARPDLPPDQDRAILA